MSNWNYIKDELPTIGETIEIELKNGCYDWGCLREDNNELYFISFFNHRHGHCSRYKINEINKWYK